MSGVECPHDRWTSEKERGDYVGEPIRFCCLDCGHIEVFWWTDQKYAHTTHVKNEDGIHVRVSEG